MQLQTILCEQPSLAFGGTLEKMPNATVAVYSDIGVDTVLASIFDTAGAPIANPNTADANGEISFRAANGTYDIVITSADLAYTNTLQEFAFFDPATSISVPGVLVDKGGWNANTNSPALASGVGTDGWMYRVTTAGATSLDGISNWKIGDKAIFNGATWERINGANLDLLYLSLGGGTLTGALALAADPTSSLHASTRQYSDKVTSRHADVSGGATLGAADLYKINYIDATAGAAIIVLSDAADNDWIAVRKKDSSANRVTVRNSGAVDLAWLSAQRDIVFLVWRDAAWNVVNKSILPITQVFTANGTYTKPPLAARVQVTAIGAGGGAGSGRRGAAGTARYPGQGGEGGSLARLDIRAVKLGSTVAVTVPAGGAGGAAVTADSTDGNPGIAGAAASFGALLVALGGRAGAAGSITAASVPPLRSVLGGSSAPTAVATSATAASSAPDDSASAGTGGNGGGISTADTAFNGAPGAASSVSSTSINGGTAGGAPGGPGVAGGAIADTELQYGGSGAGGGAGSTVGAAGAGAGGGTPGGGGSGGGASLNGNNSGAGGAGARGEVRVTTYF